MTKEELLKFRKDPVLTDFLFKNNMIVVNRDFAPEFFANLGLPGLVRPRVNKDGTSTLSGAQSVSLADAMTPITSTQPAPNTKPSDESDNSNDSDNSIEV